MISLVIGLGNIGEKYAGTRHNLGFEVLDLVSAKAGRFITGPRRKLMIG